MPAGALITGDWQIELQGLLMGDTTVYEIDRTRGGLRGWVGLPEIRPQDFEHDHTDGATGGTETYGKRIVTVALTWVYVTAGVPNETSVLAAATALETAWAKTSTDVELHVRIPSLGHRKVTGRPRGCVVDLDGINWGEGSAICTFVALDPTRNTYP